MLKIKMHMDKLTMYASAWPSSVGGPQNMLASSPEAIGCVCIAATADGAPPRWMAAGPRENEGDLGGDPSTCTAASDA